MKKVVVDTNVLIQAFADKDSISEALADYDELIIPVTVVGEFCAGLFDTKVGRETRSLFESYCRSPGVRIAGIGEKTASLYAKIFQALKAAGRPIPQNDIWIAAVAFEQGADLVTNDEHFKAIPVLNVRIASAS